MKKLNQNEKKAKGGAKSMSTLT